MLVRLLDVEVAFGGHRVLGPLSFQLNPGEKLALLGRNASGKSTLLRLIVGELEPSRGSVERASRLRIAYLPQILRESLDRTVLSFVLDGIPGLLALEAEREKVVQLLPDAGALARFGEIEAALERLGVASAPARAQAFLQGLGIPQELHSRPLVGLSGGQVTRVALARALLSPSDLLLLDEPTNHLDLLGATFLARVLAEREGAALVVTHDRALVDALGGDVLELTGGELARYKGPFARYWQERQARREQQQKAWELQQRERARQEEFIRRHIAGQNTGQAQSRQRLLAKMEELAPPPPEPEPVRLRWPHIRRSGDWLLQVEKLAVGYSTPLLRDVSFALRRGERVALVGTNGSGKSTLLRTLAGQIPPLAGSVRLGTGVHLGYGDQEQGPVGFGSPVNLLQQARPDWTLEEVRAWAGAFGFAGERAEVSAVVFSGGERCRLQLALLLAQSPNLLLLDEPTNHLDIPTVGVLEQALEDFPGGLILVSHDRRLVEKLAHRVFLLKDQRLLPVNSVEEAFAQMATGASLPKRSSVPGARRSPQAELRRRLDRQLERVRTDLALVEEDLASTEKLLGELEAAFSQVEVVTNPEKLRALAATLRQAQGKRDELWGKWCALCEVEEQLRKALAETSANP
ncbi:MAG: ABC-F family ATP-binding cassette domain-containing protein [Thermoanaerobaculaceae bacterium]